jgi:uncharacterized protein involved in exopolysaccharide biosynthesis
LERTLGSGTSREDYVKQLELEKNKLAELQKTYTGGHPEVIKQQRVVAALIKDSASAGSRVVELQPDNPAYVLLNTQFKSAESETNLLRRRIVELEEKLGRFESYIAKAPDVEKSYAEMIREMQNTTAKYREIRAKQMEAELAQSLEENRKGERFVLIEPPIRPEQPISPNRIAILLIGVVLAGIAAAATAAVQEMLDESVRGSANLAELLGFAPLAAIPYIAIDTEQQFNHQRRYLWLAAAAAGILLLLTIVHLAFKPLDVIWFIAMRNGIG